MGADRRATGQGRVLTTADYDRANALLEPNIGQKVFDNLVVHHWADDGRTLVYQTNDRDGPRWMRVDVSTGRKERLPGPPPDPAAGNAPDVTVSPDGTQALFRRGDDLWVRPTKGGTERRLTTDGEPFFSYGKLFDDSTRTISRLRTDPKLPPFNVFWSPDGHWLVGHRNDERSLLPYPFVESAPLDGSHRPKLWNVRMTLLGEPGRIVQDVFAIDSATGAKHRVDAPRGWTVDSSPVGWSADNLHAFILATAPDKRASALLEIDVRTGAVRTVVDERSDTSSAPYFFNAYEYNAPNVRIVSGGREAIWFSQRDGWGHLYLYDVASGRLKRPLTPGEGVVLDVIGVDEAQRRVFATMAGRDRGRDPYQRDLYSIPLDGGAPRRLTSPDLDHDINGTVAPFWAGIMTARKDLSAVSPDMKAFVDPASDLQTPTVTTLRSTQDGHVIAELERANATGARAIGWRPPTRFTVKAADGVTDLWGAIYLPPDYDPAKRYPVINAPYGGPQLSVGPRTFNDGGPRSTLVARNSLASLGFIVVTIDGRGTPGRSLAFWQAGYGDFADVGIDDHVAAIKALASSYPGMDLGRVGVYGHSFGGHVAARSILRHPEFYKVAISSAAVHNWQGFREAYEQYQGVIDYGGGRRIMPDATAVPDHYRTLDNAALAPRLTGKLLIAYADLDENATPSSTIQFIDALTKANRNYDLIMMPNGNHGFGIDPYFLRRSIDYFVENLAGGTPPPNFTIRMAPWR